MGGVAFFLYYGHLKVCLMSTFKMRIKCKKWNKNVFVQQ